MFYLLRSFKMSPVSWKLYYRAITVEISLETKKHVYVLCCVRLLDLGWIFTRWTNLVFRIDWYLYFLFYSTNTFKYFQCVKILLLVWIALRNAHVKEILQSGTGLIWYLYLHKAYLNLFPFSNVFNFSKNEAQGSVHQTVCEYKIKLSFLTIL